MKNRDVERDLRAIHARLRACRKCPQVCDKPVHGPALDTRIMLVGQAPGVHEGPLGRPFAYTAGKTLFKWLHQAIGADEESIREMIYIAAIARCFPGKAKSGAGDRPPSASEIENCREHLSAEVEALQPKLILVVGKPAIAEVLGDPAFAKSGTLNDVVGKKLKAIFHGVKVDVIPLPHPSGVSRWPKMEPGKSKLDAALRLIAKEMKRL